MTWFRMGMSEWLYVCVLNVIKYLFITSFIVNLCDCRRAHAHTIIAPFSFTFYCVSFCFIIVMFCCVGYNLIFWDVMLEIWLLLLMTQFKFNLSPPLQPYTLNTSAQKFNHPRGFVFIGSAQKFESHFECNQTKTKTRKTRNFIESCICPWDKNVLFLLFCCVKMGGCLFYHFTDCYICLTTSDFYFSFFLFLNIVMAFNDHFWLNLFNLVYTIYVSIFI